MDDVLFKLDVEDKLVDSMILEMEVELAYDVGTPLMMADAVADNGAGVGVDMGDDVTSGMVTWSTAVGTPDGQGKGGTAGTVKSLGNGGTGGTDGNTVTAAAAATVGAEGSKVCCPTGLPLPSTVAMTFTTTVTTLGSWRRWKTRCDSVMASSSFRSRANSGPSTTLSSTTSFSCSSSRSFTMAALGGESWAGRRRR